MAAALRPGAVLITGASTGIGAAYAERLARRGHDLVLVARNKARLDALATRLAAEAGVTVETIEADLTAQPDMARIEERLKTDAAIVMLVNNAGVVGDGPLATASPDKLETMIRLNVLVPTRLTTAILPRLVAAGAGTIVNIASVVALMPESFDGSYGASKAFVLNQTLSLAKEVADKGVRIQAVLPGITRTEIWDHTKVSLDSLPSHMIMTVGDMVDAALAGLDQGEVVTIPSLPDTADWQAYLGMLGKLAPNLSHSRPAARYGLGASAAA